MMNPNAPVCDFWLSLTDSATFAATVSLAAAA
jgi:hypothetical protein